MGDVLAVQARELGRRFGRHWALAHVDLDARTGEVLLLAGPNGSGKTTLLRILAGLSRPTVGELRVFGIDPAERRTDCRRAVSLITHQNYIYEALTALEMVRVWARLLGRSLDEEALLEPLVEVGLAHRKNEVVATFSAGMRKRLTLVRARLEDPRLVLLDEPFAALDEPGQRLIERWIDDFRQRGVTVIMASHALARASRLSSRAVFLEQGQIRWQGPSAALLERLEATA
jgi:heme exporter protein A